LRPCTKRIAPVYDGLYRPGLKQFDQVIGPGFCLSVRTPILLLPASARL